MDITITIYYNVGADVNKAQQLQTYLNKMAEKAGLMANENNSKHIFSHSYFHETYRTTKKKANNFADTIRKMECVDRVNVVIKE